MKQTKFSIGRKQQGRGGQSQDTHKLKQRSFDQQSPVGGEKIYKSQARGDLTIPAIEASSRVSIQQIAAQNNSELLHYYSAQANGALPSSKKAGKLCTISSSLALIPDEERLSDLEEVEACSGRAAGAKKEPNDASA